MVQWIRILSRGGHQQPRGKQPGKSWTNLIKMQRTGSRMSARGGS
jgi:hypothetical protein